MVSSPSKSSTCLSISSNCSFLWRIFDSDLRLKQKQQFQSTNCIEQLIARAPKSLKFRSLLLALQLQPQKHLLGAAHNFIRISSSSFSVESFLFLKVFFHILYVLAVCHCVRKWWKILPLYAGSSTGRYKQDLIETSARERISLSHRGENVSLGISAVIEILQRNLEPHLRKFLSANKFCIFSAYTRFLEFISLTLIV